MRKDLKKNKKGFTLVEIIVVLLIIGILLAITIPSIMGYVGKAKNAQYEAEARSGYVAAQTIVAREVANGKTPAITTAKITEELEETTATIAASACKIENNKITKCVFAPTSNSKKAVIFDATKDAEEPTSVTDGTAAYTDTSIADLLN